MAGTAQQQRAYNGPRILERGFWPFFLSAGLLAGLAMPVWAAMQAGGFALASNLGNREWHLHEMLFGYLSAVLAGFLLTAIPNWTGRLPVIGTRLFLLWCLWLAGRIAMALSNFAPLIAAITDGAFLVVFASLIWREVLMGGSYRNLPVCVLVSLLAIANIMFHYAWLAGDETQQFEHLALAAIALLISLIGGRIVPSFTRNWMVKNKIAPLPAPFGLVDKLALGAGVITIAAWALVPDNRAMAVLFGAACVLYLVRLGRWRGWACGREPLVWILHVAYLWLPVWFGLMAAAIWLPDVFDSTAMLHGLTAGAIGTMTIAVMTRATLGHSGRALTAGAGTTAIYGLIIGGALVRVGAPWLDNGLIAPEIFAALMWSAGYLLFFVLYARLCTGRRA